MGYAHQYDLCIKGRFDCSDPALHGIDINCFPDKLFTEDDYSVGKCLVLILSAQVELMLMDWILTL